MAQLIVSGNRRMRADLRGSDPTPIQASSQHQEREGKHFIMD